MTVPNGSSGITAGDFGTSNTITQLPGRTQTNAENHYKAQVQSSPSWIASTPILSAVINAFIAGFLRLIGDAIGDWVPFIGDDIENILDGWANNLQRQSTATANALSTGAATVNTTTGLSEPSSPKIHDIWKDTTTGVEVTKVWTGVAWVPTTYQAAVEAQDTSTANAVAIAAITNQFNADAAGSGGTFSDPFDAGLRSGYWSIINPSSMAYGWANGQMSLVSVAPAGNIWFLSKVPPGDPVRTPGDPLLTGNDFDASIVIGLNKDSSISDGAIVWRSTSDASNYGYVKYISNRVYLGWATLSGATVTEHPWVNVPATISTGKRLRVTGIGGAGTSTYRVYLNDAPTPIITYPDSAGTKAVGSTYRYAGFRMRQILDTDGYTRYLSTNVASFNLADLTAPTFLGTGWHLTRAVNSNSGSSGTVAEGAALASDCFTVPEANPNVGISDLGSGLIQIQKSGWYSISVTLRFSAAATNACIGLHKGTTPTTAGLARVRVSETTDDVRKAGAWVVYCNAGDYLRPFVLLASGSVSMVGDSPGLNNTFSGALIS